MTALSSRTIAGCVVLAAGTALLYFVFQPRRPPAAPRAFTSSEQCAPCHAEVWREWQASWHSRAWTDPDVLALSNDFANTDCIDCHAPRPVFETGIGQRVLPRSARRAEGVDCIACHLLPEGAGGEGGTVAGTIDAPSAECQPVTRRELAQPEFCGVCHDQHKTIEQWRATSYAAQGIGCVDCHMPFRDGDPNRGRDHTMHGAHDLELVRSAVRLEARRVGTRVVASVENVAAGHHFPTDERSRAADVFWRPVPQGGETAVPWRFAYRFRSPYRHEVDLVDTLLAAHERREIEIDAAAESGAVEVALFFRLTPYWKNPDAPDPEQESQLLHKVVVSP